MQELDMELRVGGAIRGGGDASLLRALCRSEDLTSRTGAWAGHAERACRGCPSLLGGSTNRSVRPAVADTSAIFWIPSLGSGTALVPAPRVGVDLCGAYRPPGDRAADSMVPA
mmetsp:Transcript_82344/g.233284  ORF Transcript_82344/g.233284 Transcript_82344/m.233284 type:complete len:113 (-) Transcript_82344:28-366(-)